MAGVHDGHVKLLIDSGECPEASIRTVEHVGVVGNGAAAAAEVVSLKRMVGAVAGSDGSVLAGSMPEEAEKLPAAEAWLQQLAGLK
eukprot:COSAG01_NODE_70627_length_258_cov_0.647799_1_plen_85_part_11